MLGVNPHQSYGHFIFGESCSGASLNFRHNLNIPQGPGGAFMCGVRSIIGDVHLVSATANTFVVESNTANWIAEFIPLVQIGDYS